MEVTEKEDHHYLSLTKCKHTVSSDLDLDPEYKVSYEKILLHLHISLVLSHQFLKEKKKMS